MCHNATDWVTARISSSYRVTRERPDALFVAPDTFFASRAAQFAVLTGRERLPSAYWNRDIVAARGLMSY
jgi:hypothetical protein